ncbi:MAG: type II toxin-antitoxin system RelE/ParE family toxin [Halothiobacillaceae bacterium]|nr:MAG: type II toxin-antitoxin system RelE/ParE family toxin [Halothiobacillaceae bacterium]
MAVWTVRLARQAGLDIEAILTWTADQFSPQQAEVYAETLTQAIEALFEGPEILGARQRDDILPGVFVLHVARGGRRGHHFIVFRPRDGHCMDVLRVLHDSMDFKRHLAEPVFQPD